VAAAARAIPFGGSPSYCFATRNVRAWSSDPQGMLVETNPRRNGGHRYYRVELAAIAASLTVRHSWAPVRPAEWPDLRQSRAIGSHRRVRSRRHARPRAAAPTPRQLHVEAVYPASGQASN
jgi:hypothetical protein